MNKQTKQLASPQAAAAAQRNATAFGRIHDVIARTAELQPTEQAQPVRGMDWGHPPRPPR
jgi:hypothetical protein